MIGALRTHSRDCVRVLAIVAAASLVATALALASGQAAAPTVELAGPVRSGSVPIGGVPVALHRTAVAGTGPAAPLGSSITGPDGSFRIGYPRPRHPHAVLYVLASRGAAVRLAAVLGTPAPAVSNPERGGIRAHDLQKVIRGMRGLNIEGSDIVEFSGGKQGDEWRRSRPRSWVTSS
jgi:Arginase family